MALVEVIAATNLFNKTLKNVIRSGLFRVCVYARVSTDSEDQKTSYISQIKHYSKMIKSNPDWQFVGVYADEGISGTQVKKRIQFQKMIQDALDGKIDIIIAKSISRFARNTMDTLKYIRLLREHNVDVYFEKENIHTLDMNSEMWLTLYSAFAQGESESISTNIKLGLKAKMKEGKAVGFYGCYGLHWDKEKKEYVIIEHQAEVVRRIFQLYIDGVGTGRIAKILTKEGIPTAKGKSNWQQATIVRIITNEKYVGDLMTQKSYVEDPLTHKKKLNYGEMDKYYTMNHHVAIIDRETWNKAQEIYKKRSKQAKPDGHTHCDKYSRRYAFSSKIICAFCNCYYVRRTCKKKNGEGKHVYWACSHRVASGSVCESRSIRDDYLKEIFLKVFQNICNTHKKDKKKLFETIKSTLVNLDFEKDLQKNNDEIQHLKDKKSKLVDMKLENYIDKETYILKEQEINNKIKYYEQENEKIYSKIQETENINDRLQKIEKILNSKTSLKEFDKEIFENLVECIIVGAINEDGTKDPYAINFILKTGKEYKFNLEEENHKKLENSSLSNEELIKNDRLSLDKDRRSSICWRGILYQ